MGLAERDYNRTPRRHPLMENMRLWSITTWLIAICVAVFLVDLLTVGLVTRVGYFSSATAVGGLQLWRFITFQFLHASQLHILSNMLSLYFFGPMVERYLGPRRYLAFYLLCGMAGAGAYMLLLTLHLLIGSPYTPLVGASAGIFGVLIAATRIAPNTTVMLLFPPIPLKLKTLAWVLLGISVVVLFTQGTNAGGEAAHLGGAALGYALIQYPQVLNIFAIWPRRKRKRSGWKMDDWR